jgi:hypothetical protein
MSEEPAQPIDRKLQAEASLYDVPFKAYSQMSPRERGMAKAQWAKRLRKEARKRRIDEEEFLAMTEDERATAREKNPEQEPPPKKRARKNKTNGAAPTLEAVAAKHAPQEPAPVVSTTADQVPPTESDPRRRTHMSIGPIKPVEGEDLVGVAAPKTLQDIYARWPIGDGQHYLRVERVQPKVWQQLPVAGYLAEIKEPITEEQFQRFFGGKEYAVTLYGPDPKGRQDPNTGLPVIKAKTDPIKIHVPMLPPNLAVLPAAKPTKKEEVEQMGQHNPFATLFGAGQAGVPMTPADATMHRTTMDFMGGILKRGEDESRELRRELDKRGNMSDGALRVIGDTNKAAMDASARAAEAREKVLNEQLSEARAERRRLEEKIDRMAQNGKGDGEALKTLEILNPQAAAADALNSAKERHADELRHTRETHSETLRALKDRHKEEMDRARERERDTEDRNRRKVEDLEKAAEKREKELKEEIDRVRRDEREVAETRVKETEKRYEDRIRDVKEQHDRELRMNEQHSTTRLDTQKATLEMAKNNAEERAQAAREEAERARQEAEDAKDPIKVKEKAEGLAEAFGYEKKDENAPQTAGERLAAGVGLGLGKALESAQDWLPGTLKEVAQIRAGHTPGQPGTPQLPPGMTPAQAAAMAAAQQQPPRRRTRAVAWASQGGVPVAGAQPKVPQGDVGMSGLAESQPAQPAPAQPAEAAPPPTGNAAPGPEAQPAQPVQPVNAPEPPVIQRLREAGIGPELVAQFRQEVEMAIETGFSADMFAERFVKAYPEPSLQLSTRVQPNDVFEIVEAMGGAGSPILRRDGKKWVETLWEGLRNANAMEAEGQASQPSA